MPLTRSKLSCAIEWAISKAVSGFNAVKTDDRKSYSLEPAVGTFDQVYAAQHSLASSASVTIDLSSFTNLAGEAVTADAIVGVMVAVSGTNAAAQVEPGASNPLTWFFGGTSPTITVPTGGVFLFVEPSPGEPISGSAKTIKITNSGAGAGTVDVVAIVSD